MTIPPEACTTAYSDWWENAGPWLGPASDPGAVSHEAFCAGWEASRDALPTGPASGELSDVINRIAGEISLPIGTAVELLRVIDGYAGQRTERALLSLAAEFEERGRCCGTDAARSGWLAAARVARDAATRHQEPLGAVGAHTEPSQSGSGAQGAAERAGEQP